MNMNNMALRTAIVIALGAVPPIVSAATTYAPNSPITLARELTVAVGSAVDFGSGVGTYLKIDVGAMAGREVTTTIPLEVRLTLTNGATFDTQAAANLYCEYTADFGNQVAQSVLQAAPEIATFKLPAGQFTAAAPACYYNGKIKLTNGSQGGNASYGMIASAYLNSTETPEDSIKTTVQGDVIVFKQAYGLVVTPAPVTIDVADPSLSTQFVNKALSGKMGFFQYAAATTETAMKLEDGNGGLTAVAAGDILGKATITLTGTPLQAGGFVTITINGQDCDKAADDYVKAPSSSGVVSFEVGGDDLGSAKGIGVCYVVDGVTKLSKGLVTFDATTAGDINRIPNVTVTGDKTFTKFYKNGTSVKVLTIPAPDDVNNPFNLRIYNMGATTAKVYGTLYQVDGQILGGKSSVELASVDPNAVKVFKSSDLGKVFGVTTWTGRAWMQIEGDSQQIRVQALAKTNGVMVNMSDRVLEDRGAFYRSDSKWGATK